MKLYGKLDEEAITDISCNLKAFEEYDDVYYTTKEAVSMYDVYVPFEENLDADWLPYNCTIVEYDIFFKDGEYYYEGEEPDDSGERTFEYSYNVDSIVEWFKDYIDQDDIIEAHGGVEEVTAKDIVDDIFCESDSWYDAFIQNFDIESDVVENMYSEDIAEQIKEVAGDKLVDYYTKYLKELQK